MDRLSYLNSKENTQNAHEKTNSIPFCNFIHLLCYAGFSSETIK